MFYFSVVNCQCCWFDKNIFRILHGTEHPFLGITQCRNLWKLRWYLSDSYSRVPVRHSETNLLLQKYFVFYVHELLISQFFILYANFNQYSLSLNFWIGQTLSLKAFTKYIQRKMNFHACFIQRILCAKIETFKLTGIKLWSVQVLFTESHVIWLFDHTLIIKISIYYILLLSGTLLSVPPIEN